MPSANQTRKNALSPTQKLKVYDFEGVQFVGARVTDSGLNDIQFTKMTAFAGYQKRPHVSSGGSLTASSGTYFRSGLERKFSFISNPNYVGASDSSSGAKWPISYGVLPTDALFTSLGIADGFNKQGRTGFGLKDGVNIFDQFQSTGGDNSTFMSIPVSIDKSQLGAYGNSGDYMNFADYEEYLLDSTNTLIIPLELTTAIAQPSEFYEPMASFTFSMATGIADSKLSAFFVRDNLSSKEKDGRIQVGSSAGIINQTVLSEHSVKFVTTNNLPLETFSTIGFAAATTSQTIAMEYDNAANRLHFMEAAADGYVDPREIQENTELEIGAGQFGLTQTRETQHKLGGTQGHLDDNNVHFSRLQGFSSLDGNSVSDPMSGFRFDREDRPLSGLTADRITGPFLNVMEKQGVEGFIDGTRGASSARGPNGRYGETGGASWPGFERHPRDIAIDSADPNTLWEDICGNSYALSQANDDLWNEFFRKGNKLKITFRGDPSVTTKAMFEAIGWVANKDGHGADPAIHDTFHLTTDLRTYLETNGATSLGTLGASHQALVSLVRTNNVNLNSLPVYSHDNLKKLTFAHTRFDDGFGGEYGPGSGISAYQLWLALGSFEDSFGGGGFQPGRIIYQTADGNPYATTEDAGGNITITNDMTYSAVIVESVQDEISEEWYIIITSESGTFDKTKNLRSRQNGIRHNKQTHAMKHDASSAIGFGNGYYKYGTNSATDLGTANDTRGPIERHIQYAKYNVDRDGNMGTISDKVEDTELGINFRFDHLHHFRAENQPTRIGYVDDLPRNSSQNSRGSRDSDNTLDPTSGSTTGPTIINSNTPASLGVRGVCHFIAPKDLADVSAPTTHTPSSRSNQIRTSDTRGIVYPFKYQAPMYTLDSVYYQKFTNITFNSRLGNARYGDLGNSGIWYDQPALISGFFANNYANPGIHRAGGQIAGQLPRFDIPYDTPNPTAFRISTTEFKAEIAGSYYTTGGWRPIHYMSHVAHPGICIVRSKVFESTNPDDYTEIVAISRDMTKKSWSGSSSLSGVQSSASRKLCTIPAMSYIIEEPGSYVVTYIAKFLRRDGAGNKLVYINNHDSMTTDAGKALTQEQTQPIVTFETI